ncbi:MAG TPA: XrtA system polysaccharide chain length determinant [Burkholderiales bacterium]|nr:XrtA system polysaccharide chain length determinant [Burkholderiales bacterium]
MDELLQQLMTYLRGMWRRRWPGLAVAWIVGIAGAVMLFKMPDQYEASARVYVDTQSVLKPLMSGLAVQPNVNQQIAILSRTLISRPNMEKLIRMADLDHNIRTNRQKEQLIDSLMKKLELRGSDRQNLYTINYRDTNPAEARRVVQSLLSMFVESGIGDKRKGSDTARRFIDDQIAVYEGKLREAENRVKEFKLKHMGMMGGDGNQYYEQMQRLNEELARVNLELRAAEQVRDSYRSQLAGEEAVYMPDGTALVARGPMSEIDMRIEAQKRSLDDLLRRFTEAHPDVQYTRRMIASLEAEKKERGTSDTAMSGNVGGMGPINTNPVFQQLKVALAESEANVAALQARTQELASRVEKMRASAQMLPEVEAQYAALNRDYDVQRRNYTTLVQRRESATLSGEMDAAAGLADFRIIDPPSVSATPVAPNRLLMLPAVLFVALGAGLFFAFVISQALPTFHDARGLREVSGRPVLGTVSLLTNAAMNRQRRRNIALFAGGLAGLFAVYGAALMLLTVGGPRI